MAPMTGTVIKDFKLDLTSKMDIKDKTILVIGGTSGLGQAIALEAHATGAKKVTVVGRSFKDAEAAPSIEFIPADLSLMKVAQKMGQTLPPADIVVLTVGILASPTRQETAEGLECDFAISYLSRYVILQSLVPRLAKNSRVFIMGFPGANVTPYALDDLNSEKKYDNMGATHFNTVMANEALVLDWAATNKDILFFGLNPGLIQTGIRANVYKSGIMKYVGPILETVIGLFFMSVKRYGKNMVELCLATDLNGQSGHMFNPHAQAVKKSEIFETDAEMAKKFIDASATLLKEKQIL